MSFDGINISDKYVNACMEKSQSSNGDGKNKNCKGKASEDNKSTEENASKQKENTIEPKEKSKENAIEKLKRVRLIKHTRLTHQFTITITEYW